MFCWSVRSVSGCCSCFIFSSRRRHTRWNCDWSSDVCSSDLTSWRSLVRGYVHPTVNRLSIRIVETVDECQEHWPVVDSVLDQRPRPVTVGEDVIERKFPIAVSSRPSHRGAKLLRDNGDDRTSWRAGWGGGWGSGATIEERAVHPHDDLVDGDLTVSIGITGSARVDVFT